MKYNASLYNDTSQKDSYTSLFTTLRKAIKCIFSKLLTRFLLLGSEVRVSY